MDRRSLGVGNVDISDRAKALVMETLSNNRLSFGPMTERFEREFARVHDCGFGVMSNSGTSALHIAVAAMKSMHGWQPQDEILVPAVTFVATANVVLHNDLHPVLVDVDPVHYELEAKLLEERITPRTRAIIPVHLFGQPCDMDPILDVARRRKLKIIEDSCETMFARYRDRSVGALGDIACFSTHVAHLLGTGIGGLNTTNDPEHAIILRSLMNHGRDSIYISIDDDQNKTADEMRLIFARRFRFIHLGHSFRCTEMEAALGLAQLEEWETMIARRRNNAAFLSRGLERLSDRMQLPAIRPDTDHSFMMYPLVLRDEKKDEIVNFLEQHGIETRDMMPLTNQPIYRDVLGIKEEDYPVAKWINDNGFYIGCYQGLSDADLEYMVEVFERFWRARATMPAVGSALIIELRDDVDALRNALEVIPFDMFARVVALDPGPKNGEVQQLLFKHDIRHVVLGRADPIAFLAEDAISLECDRLVLFTADGRHNPDDVGKLLLALERGNDMAIGSRFIVGGSRYDRNQRIPYRSVGNRVFTLLGNLLFLGNYTDMVSTYRAIRSTRLREAHLERGGVVGMYDLSILAIVNSWKVTEVPTVEHFGPSRDDRPRAWASVFPMLRVLASKWYCRGRGNR